MSDMLYTIEWAANPIATKIRLTEAGRLRLKLGIAMDWLEQAWCCAKLAREQQDLKWADSHHFEFTGVDNDTLARAIDRRAATCERELAESHCGDCTCVPMSCAKCYAESMLGVDTIAGLGKYPGAVVAGAFAGERTTIAEALAQIAKPIQPSWGMPADWSPHMERWQQERRDATAWLEQYQRTHGFK
jgi:hypothetical protein